ncbi:MAG TPA: amino acid adenylation domain-containing protein [Coleofasciculaceae cyanobacterium]|jgi:amino acid adenylation domain-containing protein/thioester reductase-like protein
MNQKNIANIYPMTPMQQGILFHTLNAPQTGIYVVQSSYQFNNQINLPAFKQAWQQVINQHCVLRTSFHWQQHHEPFQVVHKQVELPWREWRQGDFGIENNEREQLEAWLEKDRQEGFNLNQAPLMRLSLIHLANNTYQFIWSCHHLILDGWSTALILKQVLDNYQALSQGQHLLLTPSRPYADYVAWLRQQDLSQAKTYWQKALQGFTAPTSIFRLFPGEIEEESKEASLKLSFETTAALQSLGKKHRLTFNTILQGAWALLLSRYSGQEDIVFGATSSGRPLNLVGSESMVGLFINTLPVRVKVPANESLIPWLQKLQNQQIEAHQYEYTPLVQVQEWSDVPKNLPLFESVLVFENYPVDTSIAKFASQMQIEEIKSIESTNYPLAISAGLSDELFLEILFDRARFDAVTVRRILGHLEHLLAEFVAKPEANLADLSILTNAEKQQILIDQNNNRVNYKNNLCIHQLFEQQVAKTPDAIAVISQNQQLTYQELDRRAEQLAVYLQSIGVKSEVIVGICLERSLEVVVAILAILKAGGAYLPLDPAYPQQRLDYIVQDAQISLVLTQQPLKDKIRQQSIRVIAIDTQWQTIIRSQQQNLTRHVNPDSLAYVIYTSGSTGNPKGVLVDHYNVVRLFTATQDWYNFDHNDVWTLFHSYAFDFSVWEIWGALIYGGKLVIVPYLVSRSPDSFYQLLLDEKVTVLNQTPSAFSQLIQIDERSNLNSRLNLRLIIFGGEALEIHSLKPWFERHGDRQPQLVNMYGITETTVHVTYRPLTIADTNHQSSVIGCPIPDLKLYLLDSYLQPVPIGVVGEMYVAGAGVARGYLNREQLTQERFIKDPFSNNSKSRLYKSGDLARYSSTGELEYLGRIDHQVKIRGFRIELGEIEALLASHEDIGQTIAIVREDRSGNKHIVAYAIPKPNKVIDVKTIRQYLQAHLPDYMIPAAFVTLDSFPLTNNGKINRDALPTPDLINPVTKLDYVAPRTNTEKQMAEIWQEVLVISQVGIYDNFFDLGGHSLLIVRLFASIRAVFKIDLPFQFLFDAPILIDFVEKLENKKTGRLGDGETGRLGLELNKEAVLDCTISLQDRQFEYPDSINSIFLTGATGFLGAFLLSELLQQTEANIYCLVRANNLETGKDKIEQSLVNYLLWQDVFSFRIIPIIGDLSQPFLGLSEAKFQSLAESIDLIYHNGAWVHHTTPYSTLKAANVLGTKEILRLASINKIKPVHFISTISVFSGVNNSGDRLITATSKIDDFGVPEGGYAQSKWVADKLVTLARDRGLPVTIYRPGSISGHSKTGVFNPNDFLYRLLIGCIQLGCIPQGDLLDSLVPVDYVSQAIVSISVQPQSLNKAFHLVNGDCAERTAEGDRLDLNILTNLIRDFGYELKELSEEQWQIKLAEIAENQPEHPLYPLISLLSFSGARENLLPLQFNCQNTLQALKNTAISCPSTDEKLLRTYLSYLRENGFLDTSRPPVMSN